MYARYVPPTKGPKARSTAQPPAMPSSALDPSQSTTHMDAMKPKLVEEFSYTRYVPASKAKSITEPASGLKIYQFFDHESTPVCSKRKRDSANETLSDSKKARKGKVESFDTNRTRKGVSSMAIELPSEKKKKNRRKRKQRTRAADDSEDSEDSDDPRTHEHTLSKSSGQKQLEDNSQSMDEDIIIGGQGEHVYEKTPESDIDTDEALVANPLPVPEVPSRERKAKRDKKRIKKASTDLPAEEEELDEKVLARHKAVLERKSKSIMLAAGVAQNQSDDSDQESVESHALEPLPQPALVPDDDSKPTYDTLPSWLSLPLRVSQETRKPFTELGIAQRPSRMLAEKGYPEAFAVQTAAIPLLLPTSNQRPGDVLVSAATGSGKTLAYVLPIVHDISQGVVTRLRALVVLPTRELVKQAQEVFEVCAKAYEGEDRKRVRVGVAIGSQSIKSEQDAFIECDSRYDPDAYQKIHEEFKKRRASGPASADVDDASDVDSATGDPRLGPWEGEVVDFMSKVDVLICTPGRLVEHIEQTPGFNLDYVRWLVVDEADKLLAQSFQGWLDLVLEKLQTNKFSARSFPDTAYSGVRKVILSATLTRDLSLLNQLTLRRPHLIVLENDTTIQVAEHALPMTLREYAVRVHEANLKPLYLLDLLQGPHMNEVSATTNASKEIDDSPSGSSSDTSSDDSDTSSDSSDTSSNSDHSSGDDGNTETAVVSKSKLPISLIFTKSNESALRLSRLLTLLDPSIAWQISTLTSTTPTHTRRKILRAFTTPSSPVRVIIASDLVSRGIDIPKLGHVINYDLPASVSGYVHRVGRTARAGRSGCAWTLIGDDESGWFWGKVAKNQGMKRAQKVDRTRIEEMSENRIKEYEDALAKLGKEALEVKRKK